MMKSSDSFNEAIAAQDKDLEELHNVVKRLGHTSVLISNELDDQNKLLNDLEHQVDKETNLIKKVDNKVKKMLKSKDKLWCYVIALTAVFLILVLAIIFL